jgi:hypothetical protein
MALTKELEKFNTSFTYLSILFVQTTCKRKKFLFAFLKNLLKSISTCDYSYTFKKYVHIDN